MKKVLVAMSGGVDSSVAAALLQKQGYFVVGAYMRNWSKEIPGVTACTWEQDQRDARRVAEKLGIPFYTFNFEKEYYDAVVSDFFAQYKAGRTPNPDVLCNKFVKFGAFLKKALELKFDFVATGHYARVASEIKNQKSKIKIKEVYYSLLKGKDPKKDQSYFLWTLNQEQLARTLFPIGNYQKDEIRKLAKQFDLPTAGKKDSQGICFIGQVQVQKFLATELKPRKGKVLDSAGNVIGEHQGAWFYTIGQRHGLGQIQKLNMEIPPLYVISKDMKANTIVVGEDAELLRKDLVVKKIHLIKPSDILKNVRGLKAKIRYGQEEQQIAISCQPSAVSKKTKITFAQAQRAITPGQSVVFYNKDECLGGGIIEE